MSAGTVPSLNLNTTYGSQCSSLPKFLCYRNNYCWCCLFFNNLPLEYQRIFQV